MDPILSLPVHEIIARLGLQPHPEGGFYAETFRSPLRVTLPDGRGRAACTSIHFLLRAGEFSAWHRVSSDEIWHFHGGNPLELVTLDPEGNIGRTLLGDDLAAGERTHQVVPAGHWQAARPVVGKETGEGRTLVVCTVSPGFDFADFEMPGRAELLRLFPQHEELVTRFTREGVVGWLKPLKG
jgi:predicted cupin superfamily sugar epimerase